PPPAPQQSPPTKCPKFHSQNTLPIPEDTALRPIVGGNCCRNAALSPAFIANSSRDTDWQPSAAARHCGVNNLLQGLRSPRFGAAVPPAGGNVMTAHDLSPICAALGG